MIQKCTYVPFFFFLFEVQLLRMTDSELKALHLLCYLAAKILYNKFTFTFSIIRI